MYKIMLVGDYLSEKAASEGKAFGGSTLWFLTDLLSSVGIKLSECYSTNVFNQVPSPRPDPISFCGDKAAGLSGYPPLAGKKYCRKEFLPELDRLHVEINSYDPEVIVALGPVASWALLQSTGIKAIRGAVAPTPEALPLSRPYKVIPTYHPDTVLREYSLRPIVMSDLNKAKEESAFPEVRRPERIIWIKPTLQDLADFEQHLTTPLLSVDIESYGDQITCIGFAPTPNLALVVPFHTKYNDGNYWRALDEEIIAWSYVRKWLTNYPCLFQNGFYDMQFLWRRYGIPTPLAAHDTMLLHHAWQPEMLKGLGFLATIYTNEASWKFMRKGNKHD